MSESSSTLETPAQPGETSCSQPTETLVASSPPVALFQGFDSFQNAGRSTAVQGDSQSAGATSQTYYKVCSDIETLSQSLNISASLSASFGFGSVDAKTQFMERLNVTTTSVAIVVYTNIVTSHETVTDVALSVAPPSNLEAFFQSYGDSFLSDLALGAEFMAVYLFDSQSVEEQQQVQASLKASGIDGAGSLDASLQSSLDQARTQAQVTTSLQQLIVGVSAPSYPSAENIISFALAFGSTKPDSPAVVSYGVTGYEHVVGMPDFSSIVATRNLFLGVGSQIGLATRYATLQANLNAVQEIEDAYQTYGYTGDTSLDKGKTAIAADLATLTQLFTEIEADPTKPYAAPSLPSLAFGTPALAVSFDRSHSFGPGGGSPFSETLDEGSVLSQTRLTKIQLFASDILATWFSGCSLTYEADTGTQTYNHGSTAQLPSPVLLLQANEWITEVDGAYGPFLFQLTLKTNLGHTLTWPSSLDGTHGFEVFSWKSSDPSQLLLGFTGGSVDGGSNLYGVFSIGLVLISLAPATWSGTTPS